MIKKLLEHKEFEKLLEHKDLKPISKKKFRKRLFKRLGEQFRMKEPFESSSKCGHLFRQAKDYFEYGMDAYNDGNAEVADEYIDKAFNI